MLQSLYDYSLFINASDILLSRLFNLILANITILLCFFFLFPVEIEHARLKLALTIPNIIGAPITAANDAIEMLLVATD